MKRTKLAIVAVVVAVVFSIVFASVAFAAPATTWTPELSRELDRAQALTSEWASSLGNTTPKWVRHEEGQAACMSGIAVYCPGNTSINFTPTGISSWSYSTGFAGAVTQTGHEMTHHFQYALNRRMVPSVATENQGYCGSGVFLKWLVGKGVLKDAEVQYLIRVMPTALEDDLHKPGPMTDAFRLGYSTGRLAACVPMAGPLAGA